MTETLTIALLSVLCVSVIILIVILSKRQSLSNDAALMQARADSLRLEFQNTIASGNKLVAGQLSSLTGQVSDQLSSLALQMQSMTSQVNARMDNSARAVTEVRHHLGELSKAAEHIFDIGKDISGLKDILQAPKLRGGLGEFFLADLLAQCLPSSCYELQYGFRDGAKVDAIVRLKGGLVPIDSKFPLENFKRMLQGGEDEKKAARKKFIADCRKHIDAIASLYVRPEEGTLNFALMYVPAENVYYETILKDDEGGEPLASYAFARKVIPVSPNSLYAYLQAIMLGLRGMEVSEKAMHIMAHLDGLRNDFDKMMGELDTLGRHIYNSKAKYDEVQKRAERFNFKLGELKESDAIPEGEKVKSV